MLPIISTDSIQRKKEKGFSLVEAMVATAFITILSLAVIVAQVGHWNTVLSSRDRTIATQLAEETIEFTMAMRYEELEQSAFPDEGYNTIPNYPAFRRQVIIDATNPELRNVTVVISWRKADLANRPLVMVTTVTQRPETTS